MAPGVTVYLARFSVARRAKVTLALAEYREKQIRLFKIQADNIVTPPDTDETGKVLKEGDPPDVRERKIMTYMAAQTELDALEQAYLKPAVLREYITAIEGIELDGQPLTADDLDPTLADEVYDWMKEAAELSPFVGTASKLPLPSETPEGGTTNPTTATTAAA